MKGFSENGHGGQGHDFDLGIEGFRYSDLFDAVKLRDLAETFYAEVAEKNPVLSAALTKYLAAKGKGYERKVASKILTDAAPFLSDFVARIFRIEGEKHAIEKEILQQNPIWKFKFFVQRRAIKKYKAEQIANLNENELWIALTGLRNTGFDETLIRDEELSIAEMTSRLVEAEEVLAKESEPDASIKETVATVSAAYEKLKDKAFGKLFSHLDRKSTRLNSSHIQKSRMPSSA